MASAQRLRLAWRLDFQRRIEHFEHPLGAGQAGLNAVGDVRDLADLVGKLLQQVGEHKQACAQGNCPSTTR